MKCVCPMGGDRTCPNDCPVATWENLSRSDRKAQRTTIARSMFKRGMTPERIAKEQDVALATTYRDLDISQNEKSQGKDTLGRKKSTGRPKDSKKPRNQLDKARAAVKENPDATATELRQQGVSYETAEKAILEEQAYKRGLEDKTALDQSLLSKSAHEKLDAAIRAHERKLNQEFDIKVRERCKEWLNAVSLPHYTKQLEQLEQSIRNRRGIMDRITYKKILACLHPDRIADPGLKKRFEEAFRLFTDLEKRVLNEKESPTEFRKMPRTYDELMAMKNKAQADRRAKRAAMSVR